MILDWFAILPVFLAVSLLVFAPGISALAGVGLRGLALIAFAPAMSVAMISVAAILLAQIGVEWSPLSLCVVLLVVIAITWLVGFLLGRVPRQIVAAPSRWLLPVALVIGILFGLWRLAAYIQDPGGISQTNDAVFHLNAVRHILETSDASLLNVSSVIGGRGFYPGAWHTIVSMTVLLTGTEISVAANALTLVIGAGVWALGIAWLTRVMTGSSIVASYAAVLSGALHAFPLLMFQWGVLYPNALSTALIPASVAVVIMLPRWASTDRVGRGIIRAALFVGVAGGALLMAQPAAALAWGLISVIWFSTWMLTRARPAALAARIGIILAAWLVLAAIWVYFSRGTSGSHWPPFRGKLEVFADVLLNTQLRLPAAIGVSFLMLVGLVLAVRSRELRWFVGAWLAISALYVFVAAVGAPIVRDGLLGPWYADPYRITALAPIVIIPLAAVGLDGLVRLGQRVWERRGSPFAPTMAFVAIALGVASLGMIMIILFRDVAMPAFVEGTFDEESRYIAVADSYLDPDERALLEQLDDYVEEDERVLGNPGTGTGFGYFFSGVDVYPRTWSPPRSDAWAILASSLRDAQRDPAVCDALEVYGDPDFVLDFGSAEMGPGRYDMPGMTGFAGQDGFELVAREGDASLWRITACAQ